MVPFAALTALVHKGEDEKATAVIITTLFEASLFRAGVIKVPVPGLPAVKLIEAVVDAIEFVPVTL